MGDDGAGNGARIWARCNGTGDDDACGGNSDAGSKDAVGELDCDGGGATDVCIGSDGGD